MGVGVVVMGVLGRWGGVTGGRKELPAGAVPNLASVVFGVVYHYHYYVFFH